jgi:branched-chain amino acid aminotransferase
MDGRWVGWDEANIHVLSHVVHYGTSVFEGIRCYDHPQGPAIFRLRDHVRRLLDSARIYRMEMKYGMEELERVHCEAVLKNELKGCYVRPVVFRGYENLGVNPFGKPVQVAIAAFPWGKYLGEEALEKGVDVCVSSWRRPNGQTTPGMAKAGGHYMNGQLMKMEAVTNGYAEGIALDVNGFISEGSGENVFLVHRGILYTPPTSSSILAGITRDSILTLAREAGIEVREQALPREYLYLAEEVFFTGTAVELTPINSVDRIQVGSGRRGPITKAMQEAYFGILDGKRPDRYGWLTFVAKGATAGATVPSAESAVQERAAALSAAGR